MQLTSLIEKEFPRLVPSQKSAFKKLRIETVRDLLYHFPARYGNTSDMKQIAGLVGGEMAVIFGTVSGLKASKGFKTHVTMAKAVIDDGSGKMEAVWFNQPYLAKMLLENSFVRAEGKVSVRKKDGVLYMSNPKIERVEKIPTAVGESLFGEAGKEHALYPVYPESRGITSNWIYHAIQKIFRSGILESIVDPIPAEILKKYSLPTLSTALIWIHAPKEADHALAARKRFAFEEVFFIQLEKQQERAQYEKKKSFVIEKSAEEIEKFTSRFPFAQTSAQKRAIETILADFKAGKAMSRLLEGDVGSGKTAVAATTVYATVTTRPLRETIAQNRAESAKKPSTERGVLNSTTSEERKDSTKLSADFGRLQVAYMAPTEILAKQHFESFIQYFRHLPINIALMTGSGCKKFPSKVDPSGYTDISRSQLLKWVENGEIPILIGTHALIQKAVKFKNLAYIIIDEQHRFGVAQRQKLRRKDDILPHLLSMTATPIPRTLALTIFGDLDLTLLDEMPAGRKPIITEVVLPTGREETYEKIRKELQAGRQAYIICPRINEPDPDKEQALLAKSVKEEAKRLKEKVFPEYEIEILHSKMRPAEKDAVMEEFSEKKIDILVATSVVEVGVNVPNATVIVIEGAERFGLAQLHQLRGRVIRSNHQAYCYIFTESAGEKTKDRLKAFQNAKNGFELAEEDLKLRGAGDLSGRKQWGISDLAMEAMKNIKMVEAARTEAQALIAHDPTLSKFPLIKMRLEMEEKKIHFE